MTNTDPFGTWLPAAGPAHYYLGGRSLCGVPARPAGRSGFIPAKMHCPECRRLHAEQWRGMYPPLVEAGR